MGAAAHYDLRAQIFTHYQEIMIFSLADIGTHKIDIPASLIMQAHVAISAADRNELKDSTMLVTVQLYKDSM